MQEKNGNTFYSIEDLRKAKEREQTFQREQNIKLAAERKAKEKIKKQNEADFSYISKDGTILRGRDGLFEKLNTVSQNLLTTLKKAYSDECEDEGKKNGDNSNKLEKSDEEIKDKLVKSFRNGPLTWTAYFNSTCEIDVKFERETGISLADFSNDQNAKGFKKPIKILDFKAEGGAELNTSLGAQSKTLFKAKAEGNVCSTGINVSVDVGFKRKPDSISVKGVKAEFGTKKAEAKTSFVISKSKLIEISAEAKVNAASFKGFQVGIETTEETHEPNVSVKAELVTCNALNGKVVGVKSGKTSNIVSENSIAEASIGNVSMTGFDKRECKIINKQFKYSTAAKANIGNIEATGIGTKVKRNDVETTPGFNAFNVKMGINRETGTFISNKTGIFNADLSVGPPKITSNASRGGFNIGIPIFGGCSGSDGVSGECVGDDNSKSRGRDESIDVGCSSSIGDGNAGSVDGVNNKNVKCCSDESNIKSSGSNECVGGDNSKSGCDTSHDSFACSSSDGVESFCVQIGCGGSSESVGAESSNRVGNCNSDGSGKRIGDGSDESVVGSHSKSVGSNEIVGNNSIKSVCGESVSCECSKSAINGTGRHVSSGNNESASGRNSDGICDGSVESVVGGKNSKSVCDTSHGSFGCRSRGMDSVGSLSGESVSDKSSKYVHGSSSTRVGSCKNGVSSKSISDGSDESVVGGHGKNVILCSNEIVGYESIESVSGGSGESVSSECSQSVSGGSVKHVWSGNGESFSDESSKSVRGGSVERVASFSSKSVRSNGENFENVCGGSGVTVVSGGSSSDKSVNGSDSESSFFAKSERVVSCSSKSVDGGNSKYVGDSIKRGVRSGRKKGVVSGRRNFVGDGSGKSIVFDSYGSFYVGSVDGGDDTNDDSVNYGKRFRVGDGSNDRVICGSGESVVAHSNVSFSCGKDNRKRGNIKSFTFDREARVSEANIKGSKSVSPHLCFRENKLDSDAADVLSPTNYNCNQSENISKYNLKQEMRCPSKYPNLFIGNGSSSCLNEHEISHKSVKTRSSLGDSLKDPDEFNKCVVKLVKQRMNPNRLQKLECHRPTAATNNDAQYFWHESKKVEQYLLNVFAPKSNKHESVFIGHATENTHERGKTSKKSPKQKPFGSKKNIHTIFTLGESDSKEIIQKGNIVCFKDED